MFFDALILDDEFEKTGHERHGECQVGERLQLLPVEVADVQVGGVLDGVVQEHNILVVDCCFCLAFFSFGNATSFPWVESSSEGGITTSESGGGIGF